MKQKFTSTLFVLFFLIAAAQSQVINKKDKLFGGSFSFSVFNVNNAGQSYNTTGNAGVFPSFGWAIKDNLVMGIRGSAGYTRSVTDITPSGKNTASSFSAGPGIFLKKYRLLKDKFGLYFDHSASASYFFSRTKPNGGPDFTSHGWNTSYQFSPGVFYKFSGSFFGEANIGAAGISYYSNGNTKNYGINTSFLQYFNLGINYRIENRKTRKPSPKPV